MAAETNGEFPTDIWFEISRHLVSPVHYFALARTSRRIWACLCSEKALQPMQLTYFDDYTRVKERYNLERLVKNIKTPTRELCQFAVKINGYNIEAMPASYRTVDIYMIAVRNKYPYSGVPVEFRQFAELSRTAVEVDPQNVFVIPDVYRTRELYDLAVSQKPDLLERIPSEHRTHNTYYVAVANRASMLRDVPFKHRTLDMCTMAITRYGGVLDAVPDEHKSHDLYKKAIRSDPHAIRLIDPAHLKINLCRLAYELDPSTACYIPDKFRSRLATSKKKRY